MTRREHFLVGIILTLSLALPAAALYWFKAGFREGRSSTALIPYRGVVAGSAGASPCPGQ